MMSSSVREVRMQILKEVSKVVVGQEETIDLMLAGLFAGGHVLLEGVPGTAKTLMVKALASTMRLKFSRIQFTPDLMPSDVTGTSVFDPKTVEFRVEKGPIFTQFLLADEINRTPPKTQAALLEAMEERQVTLDGKTYPLDFPFMTFATQNPIEYEGTYPLAEAQVDRFALKISVGYPTFDEEMRIIEEHSKANITYDLQVVTGPEEIREIQRIVDEILVKDELARYLCEIVRKTREYQGVRLGVSPRGALQCMRVAKAYASMEGREYLIPDDIQRAAVPALAHRILLLPEAEIEGTTGEYVVREVLRGTAVPRW